MTEKRICKACNLNCLTCIDSSTKCTSCDSPLYLSGGTCVDACLEPEWGRNNTRTCGVACTESYEYGDPFDKRICKKCDNICKTCKFSALNCMSCEAPHFLSLSSCVTACPFPKWGNNNTSTCDDICANTNQFGDASDQRICKNCDLNCATCIETAIKCTSCASPLYLDSYTCVSACSAPNWGVNNTKKCESICQFENEFGDEYDNRICKRCDNNCRTCVNLSTYCLSCNPPNYLSGSSCVSTCPSPRWGNNISRTCDASCANSNEYGDASYRICKKCDLNCATCLGTSTVCTSCKFPLYLSSTICVSACPTPLWGNNSTRNCSPSCSNKNEYGDILDNRICKNCSTDCESCFGTADTCIIFVKCPSNQLLFDSKTPGGEKYDRCIKKIFLLSAHPEYNNSGFYQQDSRMDPQSGLAVALLCSSPCVTCLGKHICLTCPNGLYLYDSSSSISCIKCDRPGFSIQG